MKILMINLFIIASLISSAAAQLAPAPSPSGNGSLSVNYYANICPNLESLVQGAVRGMMSSTPIAAAATLRLFFHDCFVTVRTLLCYFL
jgi:hypothetical protein